MRLNASCAKYGECGRIPVHRKFRSAIDLSSITASEQILKAGGELDVELIAFFTRYDRFDRHTDAGAEAYVLG